MRPSFLSFLLAICAIGAPSAASSQSSVSPQAADTIFVNGRVYTGVFVQSLPPRAEFVEAIAVRDGRVVASGSTRDLLKWKSPETSIVDLGGNFVMPGFNDAHLHLGVAGLQKLNLDLAGVRSLEEFRQRLRARVKTASPGEWITGGGWDETLWSSKTVPVRKDLDDISSDHAVFLQRVDGHIAVTNSLALRLAGITAATPNPSGGRIDHDVQGQPTGILRETARNAVVAVVPPPTPETRRKAAEVALRDLAQWGITSAQDNSDFEFFKIYEQLEREGKLTARIAEWLPFDAPVSQLRQMRQSHSAADRMLRTTMLKGFMDGSLGSRTAALLQPYSDDPKNSGLPRYDQPTLDAMASERVLAGFQLGFHAIGDKGVQMALNAFAVAQKAAGQQNLGMAHAGSDFRFRIEHAQVTTPQEVQQFRDLGVIASMQPNHLLTDMNWARQRLGAERALNSYAWQEFLAAGVTLALGTDYPVEPVTPFRGLYAAVTRKNEAGTAEYYPDQALTMPQAIHAYTAGSAFAEFMEKDKGTLERGMLADFVVLDRDIIGVPPAEVLKSRVLRTVVGGKTVYEAK